MFRLRLVSLVLPLGLSVLALAGCGDAEQEPTGAGGAGGAGGSGAGGGAPAGGPTYYEDIAPILNANCASCHLEGGIAPFSLLTYEDAKVVAGLAKMKTAAREMPPWNPSNDGECNTYSNARWLTDEQIELIGAWADAGAPAGDPAKAPPAPEAPKGLAKVDLSLDTGVDYLPDDSLTDDYRCFLVDPGLVEDGFVTGYEVIPGDERVVHHVIMYTNATAAGDAQAEALDAADDGPGYQCFGGSGVGASDWTLAWAPGGSAQMYPAGTGLRIGAGRKAVIQVHYNLTNGAFPDRTKINLTLESKVDKQAQIVKVGTNDILLQPGETDAPASGTMAVPAASGSFTVWAAAPHMHTRGRTLRVEYEESNKTTCLMDVKNWNFHWQGLGIYDTPLASTGGGTLKIRCGYDTTGEMDVVKNGEGTADEMCLNLLYVTK